jgi:hypothetical protein
MGRKDTLLSVKKIISVFLVLSMLLALTACVRYSVGCTVNSDGTVNLTYLYALSDLTDGNCDSGWAEEKKEFESKGWSTRDYTGDGSSESSSYNGFIASKGGIPIDQVETEVRALGEGFESFTFSIDDGVYTIDWDTESVDKMVSEEGSSLGDLSTYGGYMKFTLELPIKPIDENATSSKGSLLEWDLSKMNEPIHCEFELPMPSDDDEDEEEEAVSKNSKKKNTKGSSFDKTLLIVLIVVFAALVVGGAMLAVFIHKKKKKDEFTAPITVPAHAPQPIAPQNQVPNEQPSYVPQDPMPSPYSSSGLPDPFTSGNSTSYTPGLPDPFSGNKDNGQDQPDP